MKVIDIDTKELIEEIGDFPGIFWSTKEHWVEYKQWCRYMEKLQNKSFYGKK